SQRVHQRQGPELRGAPAVGEDQGRGTGRDARWTAMTTSSTHERAMLTTLLVVGLASGPVRHARAFSDVEGFGKPVEQGGGGGRWFTGSATDGFTCGVCHRGGHSPDLNIFGLP